MNGLSWEDDGAQEGLLTRRSAQNCLTDHELEEYLFNRLSGVTREVIEEHLDRGRNVARTTPVDRGEHPGGFSERKMGDPGSA